MIRLNRLLQRPLLRPMLRPMLRPLLMVAALAAGACAVTDPDTTGRTAGEQIDDTVTLSRVKTALLASETTDGANIEVDVYLGRVTLTGVVGSRAGIEAATRVAEAVRGVEAVENNLRLSLPEAAPP